MLSGIRPAVLAVTLTLGGSMLTACGALTDGIGSDQPTPVDEGPQRARERVQNYLDAMLTKDVQTARAQLCAPLHQAFDQSATGVNGDFAKHFTVTEATITAVRADGTAQQVSTAITVRVGDQKIPRRLTFTVTRAGDGTDTWCIAEETAGGDDPTPATPSPQPTP